MHGDRSDPGPKESQTSGKSSEAEAREQAGNQECGASQPFSLGWHAQAVCNTLSPSRRKAVKDLAPCWAPRP